MDPPPLNIPTPTPAPAPLLGDTRELEGHEWSGDRSVNYLHELTDQLHVSVDDLRLLAINCNLSSNQLHDRRFELP